MCDTEFDIRSLVLYKSFHIGQILSCVSVRHKPLACLHVGQMLDCVRKSVISHWYVYMLSKCVAINHGRRPVNHYCHF